MFFSSLYDRLLAFSSSILIFNYISISFHLHIDRIRKEY
ncbi:hypothetical protein B4144_3150 [Bacillus atrophaeus]|nr:hypothetical protein B4144_3150 [Bacillus atrophaeus]